MRDQLIWTPEVTAAIPRADIKLPYTSPFAITSALLHDTLLADNGDNIAERCDAAYKLLCNAFIRRYVSEEECDELNAVINDFEFRFGE